MPDSVLLGGTVVRAGATVRRAVLDEHTSVGADARLGTGDGLTVTGRGAKVTAGSEPRPEETS